MPPMPNRKYQDFQWALETYRREHWARPTGSKVYHEINLAPRGGWPDDYRIPDLVLVTAARFHIDSDEYFEGAPAAVVEIRSPGDESLEKLEFYSRLGVAGGLDRRSRYEATRGVPAQGEPVREEKGQHGQLGLERSDRHRDEGYASG